MKMLLSLIAIVLIATSCGKANSDSTRAEQIPSPVSGYRCFVIYDSDGKAIGGNCVKE